MTTTIHQPFEAFVHAQQASDHQAWYPDDLEDPCDGRAYYSDACDEEDWVEARPVEDVRTVAVPARLTELHPRKPSPALRALDALPPQVHAMPNSLLQSCFISANARGDRKTATELQELPSKQGVRLRCSGTRLDAGDGEVLHMLLRWGRRYGTPTDEGMHFTSTRAKLLAALGRADGGHVRDWLDKSGERLSEVRLDLSDSKHRFRGPVIRWERVMEASQERTVVVMHEVYDLFDAGFTTYLGADRRKLHRQPLAHWLYGFLVSLTERKPAISISELHRLSGCRCKRTEFRCRLLPTALAAVNALHTVISDYAIIDDAVHATRILNHQQERFVAQREDRLKVPR